jgi:hypothetical protein
VRELTQDSGMSDAMQIVGSVVTSVSVAGATAYIASGEIEVPTSALVS